VAPRSWFFRDEAALFQRYAEVSGLLVGDDRGGVTIGFQKLPDHVVERDGVRTGQINHAVQRFRHRDAGQGCGHVIGNDGLQEGGFTSSMLANASYPPA